MLPEFHSRDTLTCVESLPVRKSEEVAGKAPQMISQVRISALGSPGPNEKYSGDVACRSSQPFFEEYRRKTGCGTTRLFRPVHWQVAQ